MFSFKIFLLLMIAFQSTSYSQMSKKDINEERVLYKNNKVKSVIIIGQNGFKSVTEIDREGKKVKSNDFYNNKEANINNYVYDSFGRLIEESYYGYESGDGFSTIYYYDEEGNVSSTITEGSDANKHVFKYDINGVVIYTEIIDVGIENSPPYIIEYENSYEGGKISSSLQLCNFKIESADYTKYQYNENLLSSIEKFDKNCNEGTLKFYSRDSYSYYPNLLIKQISSESIYNDRIEVSAYSYEYFK